MNGVELCDISGLPHAADASGHVFGCRWLATVALLGCEDKVESTGILGCR